MSTPEPSSPPAIPEAAPGPAAMPAAPAPPVAPAPPAAPAPPVAVHAGHAPYAAPAGSAAGRQRKSPVLAGLLSLMPGAGQIYVGYYKLGFIHNIIFGTNIAFLAAGGAQFSPLLPAASIFLAFFVIYNIVDASRRATCYNLALDGVEGIELPSLNDASLPLQNMRGSVGGGVILTAVGAILLSNTLLGIPLDWLAAWWPVAPLGLGIHLLAKGLKER